MIVGNSAKRRKIGKVKGAPRSVRMLPVNRNIHRLRKELELTQGQVADELGIHKTSVSKWELGLSTPDIELLPDVAALFRVSLDELLAEAA